MMAEGSWFAALTTGHSSGDAEVQAAADDYATLEDAWNSSDDPALLIWLAARLAPTFEDLSAVVATAAQLVAQRLRHIDAAGLDLAALVARASEMGEQRLDRQALSGAITQALVQ